MRDYFSSFLDYDPDTGIFRWKVNRGGGARVGDQAGYLDHGYVSIRVENKKYAAHRLAWLFCYGAFPETMLDHINRVKDDNRIGNLRLASATQNAINQTVHKGNSTGFKGVSYERKRNKYRAYVKTRGLLRFLGYFDTPEDAYLVRLGVAKLEHGEFFCP